MSMEHRFDVPFISALALREKAIQQNYRPIIAVHKWFARRPGTLFRGLMLSEFVDEDLRGSFFLSHQLRGKRIADPFMGGGTPLIEANRLGADVVGWDINPMAWWIVSREIEHLDLNTYRNVGDSLIEELRRDLGELYLTECLKCGDQVPVKYFVWVKTQRCVSCRQRNDLFPGYVLATDARHPRSVLICSDCGELNEVDDRETPGACASCTSKLTATGPARRGSLKCPSCGVTNKFPGDGTAPLVHRMFAIEYHCSACRADHRGRFFKKPSEQDIARYQVAESRWRGVAPKYVPDDPIPPGDESTRLLRWGYRYYRETFNSRQLLGLESSCRLIATQRDPAVKAALATNLSDLLRYNNLLVRYDTSALKALDLFSVHGFPVGLVRCEPNLIGIQGDRGQPIGSGGWTNILAKYRRAKDYCIRPFEVPPGSRKRIYTTGEWIGDRPRNRTSHGKTVDLICGSATEASLQPESLDAVFTDPPYYDSVQYAELMDYCYVWLRRLADADNGAFNASSTRSINELTGNDTEGRDIAHFARGLARVYSRMAAALKPGAPFVFTYHHNRASAYHPVAAAILDAKLIVTASIPCPAEMSGSIHINGTRSSIVDTVFVCRANGKIFEEKMAWGEEDFARLASVDIRELRAGGVKPRPGDTRCIVLGHITRMAVWVLHQKWNRNLPTIKKIAMVARTMADLASVDQVVNLAQRNTTLLDDTQLADAFEDADEQPALAL